MALRSPPNKWTDKARITLLIVLISLFLIILAFILEPALDVLRGMWTIMTSPGILITDFIALTNIGSALLNAAIVGLMGLGLAWIIKARFNGYLLSGFFTLMGFAFFGKTPFNIIPIFIGVYLYDQFFSNKKMRDLIAPLLFGTTLGPVVSQLAFGFGWGWAGIVAGVLIGIICGGLMASIMGHVYTFHMGYNLYNTGTSAGFIGTVVYMMMRGFGLEIAPAFYWATDSTALMTIILGTVLLFMIGIGVIWGASLDSYKKIIACDGRLASDYVEMTDLGTTLFNMGVIGLIGLLYVLLVGGDVNGATAAGILTIAGFGALGKHPRNILPIMIGVYLMCSIKIWSQNDPGPLLAALFCTTLAPFSGRFGVVAGILAGALHLPMVMHVGSLHGYMSLYNNGFAGGLAMLLIIGFLKGMRTKLLLDDN